MSLNKLLLCAIVGLLATSGAHAAAKKKAPAKTAAKTAAQDDNAPPAPADTALPAEDVAAINSRLQENSEKIKATEAEIKRIKDADFLPNLYFALADLYVEKSRLLYLMKMDANRGVPANEIDFTVEKQPKQKAIEIYQKIYLFFTSYDRRDRALFYKAHEHKELGQPRQMIETYEQLMREFPDSPYWLESSLVMGDFMFESEKNVDKALDFYKKVLAKPPNTFTSLAHYRSAWCYLNKNDQVAAYKAFEAAIDAYDRSDASLIPETYRKVDIRREATVGLVMPYVELYADANSRAVSKTESPSELIRRRSDTFLTYQKALGRLGRRLLVKQLWKEAADAYIQLLSISLDPSIRSDASQRFYEAYKKGKLADAQVHLFAEHTAKLVNEMRINPGQVSPAEQKKRISRFEIMMRDVATQAQIHARATRDKKDYEHAIAAYDSYEWAFSDSPFIADLQFNRAECEYNVARYVDAGIDYERSQAAKNASKAAARTKKNLTEASLEAYSKALMDATKLSLTEAEQARKGLREVGSTWLKTHTTAKSAPTVLFNITKSWYDERDFNSTIKEADRFAATYPNDEQLGNVVAMALNSYSQLDDYNGLQKAGARFIKLKGLKTADRDAIKDTVRNARIKQVQAKAGEFGTKEYAKNLKSIAAQNKGTELGDVALYQAFISLKSKRDAQVYEVGEQLLASHGDSQYAKEVSAAMAQMAMITVDFNRAAKYLAGFATKFPKEPESSSWAQNAANLYEWQGEYKKAKEIYLRLGNAESAARMDLLAADWPSLAESAKRVSGLKSRYWTALAMVRQNQLAAAKPLLQEIASKKGSGEERDMIAHAAYLLASDALARYKSIRQKDANDQKALQDKIQSYQALAQQLKGVINLQSGRWTIAALYVLGQANYSLGRFIKESPMPNGLTAPQKKEYATELNKQAAVYVGESKQLFTKCLAAAEDNEILTRFVDGCLAQGAKEINEADDTTTFAKSANRMPASINNLRQKLYDKPRDVDTLHAMAADYLQSGDPAAATSIYNRILEIDPKNSKARAAIGVAYLNMNDPERGYAELKKALEINPQEPVALWNIAGLMSEFKFTKKRAAAIKAAKATPKPDILSVAAQKI